MQLIHSRPPILEIEGLRKTFGDTEVLKGIDLEVDRESLVFIIGPSGSGKSTLLRCCNRLEKSTGGFIRFDGKDIASPSVNINELRQHVGMVFQSFNLYPHLTVLANITLALRKAVGQTKEESEERGRVALEQVGLSGKAGAYPSELSGGQQQRVAIARALALEPRILLMDEPTSALDPELVGSVLRVIRELKDSGMTMLIVSHEMQFAREAADQVIFLDEGEVVESGAPDRIFSSPSHERTRRFLKRILTVP